MFYDANDCARTIRIIELKTKAYSYFLTVICALRSSHYSVYYFAKQMVTERHLSAMFRSPHSNLYVEKF
jgi:hypothetical protein